MGLSNVSQIALKPDNYHILGVGVKSSLAKRGGVK